MLKIRLQRIGRKNEPSFRLVLTDSRNSTKSGRSLEILGFHNFRQDGTKFEKDKILHWISKGAQLSDTAHNLLISAKIIVGKKINVLPKKTVPKKEEVKEESKAEVKTEAKAEPKPETKTEEKKGESAPATEPTPAA